MPIGKDFNVVLPIPSWGEYYMRHVYLAASKSKDNSTKIGAVIVAKDGTIISEGYNGICRCVNDDILTRHERPEKYFWFEHGERNAIYNCARNGISTIGADMYTNGIPCADCGRGIVQAGIREVIIHLNWEKEAKNIRGGENKWRESCARTIDMFREAGVEISGFEMRLGVWALIDRQLVSV